MTVRIFRSYVEWDISGIPSGSSVTKVEFRYNGFEHHASGDNSDIRAMASKPSISSAATIYGDCADGAAYLSNDAVFPEVGVTKDVGGASGPAWDSDPKGDVETALGVGWFAIGMKTQETETPGANQNFTHDIYAEEQTDAADPKPTLYVEYTPPVAAGLEDKSAGMGSKMIAGKLI